MPSIYRDTFFDEPREASLIKLRLLEKYLVPWTIKVGSTAPGGSLCVVDGFAGRGDYADGTAGSPRLILDRARSADSRRVACVFVEKKGANASKLRTVCSSYRDVENTLIEGDFWAHIEEVLRLVKGRPLLALVDPFGVKDLDYKKIGALVNGSAKCDLVVTFVDSAVARIVATYPEDVAKAIGPRIEGEGYAATFARNMAAEGRFLPGGRFAIRQSFDSEKKYELIVFSRSHHAYQLWNDFMTKEWRIQRAERTLRKSPLQGTFAGIDEWTAASYEAEDIANAATDILEWCRKRHTTSFTRVEMLNAFVVYRFASFHTSTLKRALASLAERGSVHSDSTSGHKIDQRRWRLTDPQP